MDEVLDEARPAAQLLLADMVAEQPGNLESRGIWLAALRQYFRQRLKDQDAEDITRDEGQQDTTAVFDDLTPFDERSRHDRYLVMKSCHNQHERDA